MAHKGCVIRMFFLMGIVIAARSSHAAPVVIDSSSSCVNTTSTAIAGFNPASLVSLMTSRTPLVDAGGLNSSCVDIFFTLFRGGIRFSIQQCFGLSNLDGQQPCCPSSCWSYLRSSAVMACWNQLLSSVCQLQTAHVTGVDSSITEGLLSADYNCFTGYRSTCANITSSVLSSASPKISPSDQSVLLDTKNSLQANTSSISYYYYQDYEVGNSPPQTRSVFSSNKTNP